VLVESIAFVFPSVEGASAAFHVAGDFARYVLLDSQGLDPAAERVAVGEEAMAFAGRSRFTVFWRRGAVVALVHVHGATDAGAKKAALSLADVQEKWIENPTALPRGANDDREVPLDDPHLGAPVWWLGRHFSPGHGLPRLTLALSQEKIQQDPGHTIAASIEYSQNGGITLHLWKPARWKRFKSSKFGRAASWRSPCAEKRTLRLRRGRAELFGGYSSRHPFKPAPLPTPVPIAARHCPTRKRDEFVALVYLPHVVVEVKTAGSYESFKGLTALVRGLRPRR
jgi:hypothetical protein